MTTITDIAKELNVSTATVSRALNQSRLITPELTTKICEAADKMGYVKRNICRPRGRAILNIKLVLPRHKEPERALFYDLTSLIEGIQSGFKKCGINLLCDSTSQNYKPFPHKKGGDINGFIFAFHRPSQSTLKELNHHGTPFIILNREIPNLPCVASENANGMHQIVTHLLERRSALKPAFISLDDLGQIHDERLDALTGSCKQLGLVFHPTKHTFIFPNIHSINASKIEALSKPYNALICVNDIVGTVVLSELDRLGISVPSKIAVTGFDDSPVRQLSRPLLTTVSLPIAKLAQLAASRLEMEIIEFVRPPSILRVPGKLIVGESS